LISSAAKFGFSGKNFLKKTQRQLLRVAGAAVVGKRFQKNGSDVVTLVKEAKARF
jgi:hypothetical protein